MKRQRLELTWVSKDERPRLEPRILIEDKDKSYHSAVRKDGDIFDNILIHGDNLLALKALEAEYGGKVKCIYIDPPFNTKQAFENYDDGREHSIWLSMMRDRLNLLRTLLSDDGSIFIHIDDNELGYLICLTDEIFGRSNRIAVITFKQSSVSGPKAINPGLVTIANYIVFYAKNKTKWNPSRVYVGKQRDARYSTFIKNRTESCKIWNFAPLKKAFAEFHGCRPLDLKERFKDNFDAEIDEFVLKNADSVVQLARVDQADVNEDAKNAIRLSLSSPNEVFHVARINKDDMYFLNGKQILFYRSKTKIIDGEIITGEALSNIWDDLLSNNVHKEGGVHFPNGKKPEQLIKRILELSTNPHDIVLDSFCGSGTTGAVAHKMRRQWIMVEVGLHQDTHVRPRLKAVVDGSDQDGISKAVNWRGGGGFRVFHLAPSLCKKDSFGNWVISEKYNPEMLAEAVCKLMGFTYAPSLNPAEYWKHGHSTEQDFIYVTTASLTYDALKMLSQDVGPNRTLLVCCRAYNAKLNAFENLTLNKIPQAVLAKCEWDTDDYSLNIGNLPPVEPEPAPENGTHATRRKRKKPTEAMPLFPNDSGAGQ